jgi:phosphate transport system substrate-binding protein
VKTSPVRALPLTALLVMALSAPSACTGGDLGSGLRGSVVISGSSTVEPITSLVGELFYDQNQGVSITVEGPGTGDGFKKFCAGETDISDASRPMKPEEEGLCEEAGIEYVGIPVAFDALSVVTNSANGDVDCLSFEDLYGLVGPESDDVGTWAEAADITATTDLPDSDLDIFAPGQESGTYDSFVELALKEITEERLGDDPAKATRSFGGLADDNQIIEGIQSSESSFGWVSYAFAEGADVKILEVDGGEGCVAPSKDTVVDGTYPLARTLYIYVNVSKAEENPAVAAFVEFYLDHGPALVEEAGFITLDDDTAAAAAADWERLGIGAPQGEHPDPQTTDPKTTEQGQP